MLILLPAFFFVEDSVHAQTPAPTVAAPVLSTVASGPSKSTQFDDLVIQLEDDEATSARKASLLRALSEKEIGRFIKETAAWIPAASGFELGRWVRSIEIVSRNKQFRSDDAKVVLAILAKQQKGFGLDGKMRALRLRLTARAGGLSSDVIKKEFQSLQDTKLPSAERLVAIGALTDAMQEAGVQPSAQELEKLLASEVYEIRMHAVDWFRILEFGEKDRRQFLKVAIKSNPYQVRERVYRYLESLDDKAFYAIYSDVAGAKNGISCVMDRSEVTRKLCDEAAARAGKKPETP